MIDMERIEKAYIKFKLFHDNLHFKAFEKEVRQGPRTVSYCESVEVALEEAAELNKLLELFLEKQYTNFLDEVIVGKHIIESSD